MFLNKRILSSVSYFWKHILWRNFESTGERLEGSLGVVCSMLKEQMIEYFLFAAGSKAREIGVELFT